VAGAGGEGFWANAAKSAPNGSANAKAEPSTKRGSVRLDRRRIIAFKGSPRPQEGKIKQPTETGLRRGAAATVTIR
jgi:hypothetical protein